MISLVITVVILGFALYMVETYVPMSPPLKMLLRFIVVLFVILILLQTFGVIRIPVAR